MAKGDVAAGCCILFVVVAIFSVIFFPVISLKSISVTEAGVVYTGGPGSHKLGRVDGPGLHTGPLFFSYIRFPTVQTSLEMYPTCVTTDGLFVTLDVNTQFTIDKDSLPEVARLYRNFDKYQDIMKAAANKAIHFSCAQFLVSDYQGNRTGVQNMIKYKMQENVDKLHCVINDVQLRNVDYPSQWKDAVAAKEQALQDISLALNERDQQLAAANGTLAVAQQQATIILQNANGNATIIASQASATAQALTVQLESEAQSAAMIMSDLNLTLKGYIAYLSNRALEAHANDGSGAVKIALPAPAKASYATEL